MWQGSDVSAIASGTTSSQRATLALVVRDGAQRQSTYCTTCAADILAKADSSLKDLHTHIGTPSEHGQAE